MLQYNENGSKNRENNSFVKDCAEENDWKFHKNNWKLVKVVKKSQKVTEMW